jgi:peroxiredoxin
MRQWILSLAAVALIAGTTFAGKYNKALSIGDKAPAIAGVPAVAATGDKELTLNLTDAKEDVVVVAFLANHCPAVIACEDRLFDLVKSYSGKSVKFLGVCCSDPNSLEKEDGIEAIKGKIKEGKYNLTYGYDADGKIGKAYGAVVTPTFFVLDKDRTIRYTGKLDSGADAKGAQAYLKTAIDAVLAKETVEETETRATGCPIPYKK